MADRRSPSYDPHGKIRVSVVAVNSAGYKMEVLRFDQYQLRMKTLNIESGEHLPESYRIDPKDFPDAAFFDIVIERG